MKHGRKIVLIASLAILFFSEKSVAVEFPSPVGYVNDFAGVIDSDSRVRMESLMSQVRSQTGIEIAVVTVTSLDGLPIEDYSIELARRWGIGGKKENNGLLILIAPSERKWRIEVGYGLEGELPDGLVGEVGRRMVPYFRGERYGTGLLLGVQTVVATIAEKRGIKIEGADKSFAYSQRARRRVDRGSELGVLVSLIVLFVVVLILAAAAGTAGRGGRGGRRRWGSAWLWYPIIFGGGGSGGFGGHVGGSSHGWGGFGGGGGFGGFGGGSFGGGGASGSW